MRALTYDEYGDIDQLHVGEVDEPQAAAGQVRISVVAAGLNPLDHKVVSGMMAGGEPLAATAVTGYDAAGVVDQVGEGVTGVAVGDEVLGQGSATHARLAVLDSWVARPAAVSWDVAGALGVAVETSERGLRLLGVRPGETLFVAGGSGGVGAVLVQVAVARGITVIASAGAANQDYLAGLGATPVGYGDGLVDRVRDLVRDRAGSIDAVFDVSGQTPADDLFALAPEPAKVLSIADFTLGERGGIVSGGGPDESRPVDALTEGVRLLEAGDLVVDVQAFDLADAQRAFGLLLDGHVRGKLVLRP